MRSRWQSSEAMQPQILIKPDYFESIHYAFFLLLELMDKSKSGSFLCVMSTGFDTTVKFLSTLALLLGLSLSTNARLGEDETSLQKRFGNPIETQKVTQFDFVQYIYKNHDLLIGVTLIDGKSASEQYTRTSGKTNAQGKPVLTAIPAEIAQAILKANADGAEWKEIGLDQGARRFLRSDEEALAVFFEGKGFITEIRISSSEFNRHLFPKVTE